MLGKVILLKATTLLVFSLWLVKSKKNAEKCGFSDFQYGFRSSRSTANILTVVPNRIAKEFNRSGATRAVVVDISKAFHSDWHASILHKLKSY